MIQKFIKPIALAFLLSTTVAGVNAQSKKDENIIIRKKSDSKEKLTIVVDGDKVTVNGKPIEEFKDNDVEVLLKNSKSLTLNMPDLERTFSGLKTIGYGKPNNKAFLGVSSDVTAEGAKILSVTEKSGAEKAGLQKGDVITKIDDVKLGEDKTLYNTISMLKPEDKVKITYLRDGKEKTTTATLSKQLNEVTVNGYKGQNRNFNFDYDFDKAMPNVFAQGYGKPKIGVEIKDLEEGKGVKITDVDDESAAAKAGLKEGDVITKINDQEVVDVDGMKAAVKEFKSGDSLKIEYKRDNKTATTEVKIPKKIKTAGL